MGKYQFTTDATDRFLPEEVGDYLIHRTRVMIVPKGEPNFSARGTEVEIMDEVGGEWVRVGQSRDDALLGIGLDREEWPVIRKVIDAMVARCRVEKGDADGTHD